MVVAESVLTRKVRHDARKPRFSNAAA